MLVPVLVVVVMGMSVGVTFSTATGAYTIYSEPQVDALIKDLQRADLIVGFNHLRFDYEVLHGYTTLDLRQLPTLRLFKIRMDLEMEGDTSALTQAAAEAPAETEPQPYDDLDVAVIRALQGDMPVVPEPYAPAAEALGMPQRRFLDHLQGMRERRLLRRVAAILYHRRAGFSANGMGVWKVPEERIPELGPRMAAVRGISHCYQRPTYEDWPYSVFTMAHGRSKDECDAILDSIAVDTGIEERSTLYSSTEFKKIRLLYFTDDFKRWESERL